MEKPLEKYLDEVNDKESFLAFVKALIAERHEACKIEEANPDRYQLNGALEWNNAGLVDFLDAAVACWEAVPARGPQEASWAVFADFQLCGKMYE